MSNELEKYLNEFGKSVVKQSRTRLSKSKKNDSKKLYNSLSYDLNVSKNSFSLSFNMEDYGTFIDKGVKGVGGTKANGERWEQKKVTNNSYKYKTRKPPIKALDKWSVRKGIAPRDKNGKFLSRKSVLFAISNSIFHTGLETTNFFSKPFENAFKKLPDIIIEKFGLDLDDFLDFTT